MSNLSKILAALAAEQYGILSNGQIKAAGISRGEYDRYVRNGPWECIFEGVYRHSAVAQTWEGDLLAACFTGGTGTVASHRSAARLFGLAGGTDSFIEITCRRWRRSRYDSLIVHESKLIDEADVTTVKGIPVTTVERTLLDLGAVKGRITVRMAYDRAVSSGLTTWADVNQTLRRVAKSGRPGVTKLRSVLEQRRPFNRLPESERETLLLEVMDRFGLPVAQPQVEVKDSAGRTLARVDAGYPEHRIAIEYDSDQEHTGPDALARDNARRNKLIEAGWTVVAARNQDIKSGGAEFCRTVEAVLKRVLASQEHE